MKKIMIKNILIVDNNPVVLKLLSATLEREGYTVNTANDGLVAFDILQKHTPDIIFLDLIMPNINGEQLSRIMFEMESLKNIPVILISGIASEAGKQFDIKGIDGCIAKGPNLKNFVLEIVKQFDNGSYQASAEVKGIDEVYPREVSQELLATNLHLNVVLNNMNEGMVEITQDNRIVFSNPSLSSLVGKSEEKLLAMDFTELFEGQEKQRIIELLAGLGDVPVSVDEDHTLLLKGKDVTLQIIPLRDNDAMNGAYTVIIILRDISAKKEAEKKLNEVKDYLASILSSVQSGIVIVEAESRIVIDANPVALEMLEVNRNELVGKFCYESVCSIENGNCPILDHGNKKHKAIQNLSSQNGEDMYVLRTATSFEHNNSKYIVESLVDITEQKVLEEKLHTQSITDDMTGLLNRRGFLMMARKQLKIADRSQKSLSLLFADVDKLKWINDSFGHEAGDKMLIYASKILSSFRSSDIVGRLGGDEFAVLVTGDENDESKTHIEKRFTNLLEETNSQLADRFKLSISYGVVRYDPATPCSIEELLSQADKLMYDNKKEKKSV